MEKIEKGCWETGNFLKLTKNYENRTKLTFQQI